jgi:hypothetical protein
MSAAAQSEPPPQPPQGESASQGTEPVVGAPAEEVEPDSDPSSRARHSAPPIYKPPPESHPRDILFPSVPRPLQPYLQMANRFGTHASHPGALIGYDPVSDAAQWVKSELAKSGIRYSFDQTLVGTSMSDRVKGDPVIGAYAYSFFGNWTIFEADELGGTCGC